MKSRRARLVIDFPTVGACVSRASDVLGVCIVITSGPLRTETERWREEDTISRPARSYRWVLGSLGITSMLEVPSVRAKIAVLREGRTLCCYLVYAKDGVLQGWKIAA
jgi:hypothetical protein